MKSEIFIYHDNPSGDQAFIQVGDAYAVDEGLKIFAVADSPLRGITRNLSSYPHADFGYEAARLFADGFVKYARKYIVSGRVGETVIIDILKLINKDIRKLNTRLGKDPHDPLNYDTAEAVGFGAFMYQGKLYYGGLEDCYINVLRGDNLEDVAVIKYQILKALKYANSLKEKDTYLDHLSNEIKEKINPDLHWETYWCTVLKNNPEIKDTNGNRVGWGIFNGDSNADAFYQSGVVSLEKGDQIILFSDGMIPLIENNSFTKWLLENVDPSFEFSYSMRLKAKEILGEGIPNDKEKTLVLYKYE